MQSLIFGLGGLRLTESALSLDCQWLPHGIETLSLVGIDYAGASLR